MSTTTAADAPLIDDAEFIEELRRVERVDEHRPDSRLDSRLDSRTFRDAFEALKAGLPGTCGAQPFRASQRERAPIDEPYDPLIERPAPAVIRIPVMAAVLLLVACLSAGAATAAFVFHDRVTQITALPPATR